MSEKRDARLAMAKVSRRVLPGGIYFLPRFLLRPIYRKRRRQNPRRLALMVKAIGGKGIRCRGKIESADRRHPAAAALRPAFWRPISIMASSLTWARSSLPLAVRGNVWA